MISLTLHLKAVLKIWECFNKYTGELNQKIFIDSLYQFVKMFYKLTGFISRFLFIQPAHWNILTCWHASFSMMIVLIIFPHKRESFIIMHEKISVSSFLTMNILSTQYQLTICRNYSKNFFQTARKTDKLLAWFSTPQKKR